MYRNGCFNGLGPLVRRCSGQAFRLEAFEGDDTSASRGARGQASDILIAAQEIEKTKKELYSIIAEHSGQPLERIYADGDRDFWMTSAEALEYGMIDEILTKKK